MGCECSKSEQAAPNPRQIDASHFVLFKVVGAGAFGKVNAVQRRSTGELLAMKAIRKARLLESEAHMRTLWRERNVMARFRSPFVVNLLHAFQDPWRVFLVMPFMQGGDLRFYLSTYGAMAEPTLRFYAAELVLGLAELWRLGIVYRDLKPDNVLLDAAGHLRISDFGLCTFLTQENGFRAHGAAGTPGYQAPEVVSGRGYDTRADLFSLGVTLFELAERRRPYPQDSFASRQPFRSQLSPTGLGFLEGLLELDPEQRLGARGLEELKSHAFFAGLDWEAVAAQRIKPPHQPEANRANCSPDFELYEQFVGEEPDPVPAPEQQARFAGYEFNVALTDSAAPLPAPAPEAASASPLDDRPPADAKAPAAAIGGVVATALADAGATMGLAPVAALRAPEPPAPPPQ
jgi:serine/threonine protein kinase